MSEFSLSAELRIASSVMPPHGDAIRQMRRWADRAEELAARVQELEAALRHIWNELERAEAAEARIAEVERDYKVMSDAGNAVCDKLEAAEARVFKAEAVVEAVRMLNACEEDGLGRPPCDSCRMRLRKALAAFKPRAEA